jgi:putative restriction endonuclease
MENYAYQHRDELSKSNYVRTASPNTDYWVDFHFPKLNDYRTKFGDDFNLIIIGDETIEGDFYVIPFRVVKEAFIEENIYQTPRQRWIASITFHQLRVRKCPFSIDVGGYYGIPILPEQDFGFAVSEDFVDYGIENRILEIKARQKQSLFRKRVLENFQGQCCLSTVKEENLLIASHIIPWADRIETRLDPSNGLCFSYIYDKLFDDGYFSFDDKLKVIVSDVANTLSKEIQDILISIENNRIREPSNYPISLDYIKYHRQTKMRI